MVSEVGIRFVMEGPNAVRVRQKKRARLVTACDSCRVKKIKCHQPNPKLRCEACKASRTACLFGDRDKYHAERGMTTVQSGNGAQQQIPASESSVSVCKSYTSSPASSLPGTPAVGQQWSLPSDISSLGPSTHIPPYGQGHRRTMSSSSSLSYTSSAASSVPPSVFSSPLASPAPLPRHLDDGSYQVPLPSTTQEDTSMLFDPARPQFPHPELMVHLTGLFFEHMACQLPFMDHDAIVSRINSGNLPAILCNSIAALAARFSNRPELAGARPDHKYQAGEPFLHMAKLLVVPMMSWPSLEVLHALILIAWAEYGCARDSGLFMYSRMATAMLLDLNLGSPSSCQVGQSDVERDMLRFTWWSVVRIDLTSAWVTGRPVSLKDVHFDGTFSSSQHDFPTLPSRSILFSYLTELFTLRDEVTNMMNNDGSQPSLPIEMDLAAVQARLATFQASLPASLAFTRDNFKAFTTHKQGSILLLLHLMLHGANAIVNWPSLFREFEGPTPHNTDAAYASSRSLVDAILIAKSIDPACVLTNPFFDVPVSIAARVFLSARNGGGSVNASSFNASWNEANLTTCMEALDEMSKYWGGAAIVRHLLEQRSAKEEGAVSNSTTFHVYNGNVPIASNSFPPHSILSRPGTPALIHSVSPMSTVTSSSGFSTPDLDFDFLSQTPSIMSPSFFQSPYDLNDTEDVFAACFNNQVGYDLTVPKAHEYPASPSPNRGISALQVSGIDPSVFGSSW